MQLQVSLGKEAYKRDDILQKKPTILSMLLTAATSYKIKGKKIEVMRTTGQKWGGYG